MPPVLGRLVDFMQIELGDGTKALQNSACRRTITAASLNIHWARRWKYVCKPLK